MLSPRGLRVFEMPGGELRSRQRALTLVEVTQRCGSEITDRQLDSAQQLLAQLLRAQLPALESQERQLLHGVQAAQICIELQTVNDTGLLGRHTQINVLRPQVTMGAK
jgi:hypothetical protein